jgi:DNA-binding transcriptional regulator YdaS (Cro superfamily)
MNKLTEKIALEEAVKIVGGQTALAKKCNVKQQTVFIWLKNGLPIKRVIEVERATNYKVSRHRLKPDYYPPEHTIHGKT